MKSLLRMLFFLLGLIPIYSHALFLASTGLYNLVTGMSKVISGGDIDGGGGHFIVSDANNVWDGIAPNGNVYKVSTLNYSYEGKISLTIDNNFYTSAGSDCSFSGAGRRQAFIGWTVVQPGIAGSMTKDDGALYSSSYPSGVGVQSMWAGISDGQPEFTITFNSPNTSAQVYVSNGPSGMYTMPGNGRKVYVHGPGQSPNVLPYSDIYGLSCGDVVRIGVSIPSEPIEPPQPDTVCNFWFDDNVLNLGVVDQTSASGSYVSEKINGQCNADASVNLRMSPQDYLMGGLTVHLSFDNDYSSDKKSNWQLRENQIASSTLRAEISNVGTLTPGEYSKSGVVYIDYN